MLLDDSPTIWLKYNWPNDDPPPKVVNDWKAVPAETPIITTLLSCTLLLINADIVFGYLLSLNQHLTCRDWSPPLKYIISAFAIIW